MIYCAYVYNNSPRIYMMSIDGDSQYALHLICVGDYIGLSPYPRYEDDIFILNDIIQNLNFDADIIYQSTDSETFKNFIFQLISIESL